VKVALLASDAASFLAQLTWPHAMVVHVLKPASSDGALQGVIVDV
jgi:hypothetical protein